MIFAEWAACKKPSKSSCCSYRRGQDCEWSANK